MSVTKEKLGAWSLNISDEKEVISREAHHELEKFVNNQYLPVAMPEYKQDYSIENYAMRNWGVPAPVVRLDMAPYAGDEAAVPIYEVESNVSGLGIMASFFPEMELHTTLAEALSTLGVEEIGYATTPCRHTQWEDLKISMALLADRGIETREVSLSHGLDSSLPLWLRSGHEDLEMLRPFIRQCLLLHYHGGGHKNYLRSLCGAKLVSHFQDVDEIFDWFSRGFALKPIGGWGTKKVQIWTPIVPWKRRGTTHSKVTRTIEEIVQSGESDEWLLQPFVPPVAQTKKQFRIWRVYAVWNGTCFHVVDSFWSERRSLLNHGASDTVTGKLLVPS